MENFEYGLQDKDNIALLPLDVENAEGVYLYRFKHNKDAEPEPENIEDDAEFEAVADAYDALVDDAAVDDVSVDEEQ